jgi:hypothetical protein
LLRNFLYRCGRLTFLPLTFTGALLLSSIRGGLPHNMSF